MRIIVHFLIYFIFYSVWPILFGFFPDTLGYYENLIDLLIFNPLFSIIITALISRKYNFLLYLPIVCGLAFLTCMLIFYSLDVFPFLIGYIVLSFIGNFIGEKLYERHIREIY